VRLHHPDHVESGEGASCRHSPFGGLIQTDPLVWAFFVLFVLGKGGEVDVDTSVKAGEVGLQNKNIRYESFPPSKCRCRWGAGVGGGSGKRPRVEPHFSGRGLVTHSEVATEGNGPIAAALADSRGTITPRCIRRYGARSTMPCCLGFPQQSRVQAGSPDAAWGMSWPGWTAMRKLPLGQLRQGGRRSWKKILWTADGREGDQTARPSNSRDATHPPSHRRGRHAAHSYVGTYSVKVRK